GLTCQRARRRRSQPVARSHAPVLCGLLLALAWGSPVVARPAAFVVVVNTQAPVFSLSREALSDIFLGKVTWWPNGGPMRPVDQSYDSETRTTFSDEIIGRSVRAVRTHWQQAIFSGQRPPPPVFDTDAEVLAYVRRTRGAIGYVSDGASLDGVRTVRIE